MGDRVLFIVHNRSTGTNNPTYSPIIYGHHSGAGAPSLIAKLHSRMESRRGDVEYSAARLIGIMHSETPGNLSLGVWNLPDDFSYTPDYLCEMSHGDAGVILYDCSSGEVECYGSYFSVDASGNLVETEDA